MIEHRKITDRDTLETRDTSRDRDLSRSNIADTRFEGFPRILRPPGAAGACHPVVALPRAYRIPPDDSHSVIVGHGHPRLTRTVIDSSPRLQLGVPASALAIHWIDGAVPKIGAP